MNRIVKEKSRTYRSGQLVDKPAPVTTKRSHSAGLPVSVRTQRLPLPISITGQRSLQPLQVNPEQQQQQPPPQQQRPPMTASEYQRSIYRGDSGRQAAGSAGQAAQQQPGSVPVSHAGRLQGPQEPTAEKAGPADRAPDHKNEQESVGADKAAPEQSVTAAEAASSTAVTTNEEGMTKATTSQMVVPETAPASSQVQPAHAPQQQGLGSASGEPAVQAQPLHMPPLPPPAVHHVQMGKAELDDTLKVIPSLCPRCSCRLHNNMLLPSLDLLDTPGPFIRMHLPMDDEPHQEHTHMHRWPWRSWCCWTLVPAGAAPAA